MSKTTKKDLLARLRTELFDRVNSLFNTFRGSVNEAMEINQKRVYESHLRVAGVVDAQNDRLNALVDMLIDTKAFTEQEFLDAVQAARDKRVEQLRLYREDLARQREEDAARALKEQELLEKVPMTEVSMIQEAGLETPGDGPQGFHPPEVEVFGG